MRLSPLKIKYYCLTKSIFSVSFLTSTIYYVNSQIWKEKKYLNFIKFDNFSFSTRTLENVVKSYRPFQVLDSYAIVLICSFFFSINGNYCTVLNLDVLSRIKPNRFTGCLRRADCSTIFYSRVFINFCNLDCIESVH